MCVDLLLLFKLRYAPMMTYTCNPIKFCSIPALADLSTVKQAEGEGFGHNPSVVVYLILAHPSTTPPSFS